jgi:hypothetical protein
MGGQWLPTTKLRARLSGEVQNDRQAYVSPVLVTLATDDKSSSSALRVFGLAPEDGALLWSQA